MTAANQNRFLTTSTSQVEQLLFRYQSMTRRICINVQTGNQVFKSSRSSCFQDPLYYLPLLYLVSVTVMLQLMPFMEGFPAFASLCYGLPVGWPYVLGRFCASMYMEPEPALKKKEKDSFVQTIAVIFLLFWDICVRIYTHGIPNISLLDQ